VEEGKENESPKEEEGKGRFVGEKRKTAAINTGRRKVRKVGTPEETGRGTYNIWKSQKRKLDQ